MLINRLENREEGSLRRSTAGALVVVALLLVTPFAVSAAPGDDALTPWDVAALRSVQEAVVSPDGTRIAYVLAVPRDPFAGDDGRAYQELHLAGPDGATRPFVGGKVAVKKVAWTPGGSAIGFLAKRDGDDAVALYVIPADGGEARRLVARASDVEEFSFGPDGKRLAYLAEDEEPEEKKALKEKGFDQEVFEEEWRPVRVWIVELPGGPLDAAPSGEPRALDLAGSASELHWSPAGDRLAVALAPTPLVDDEYMARRVKVVDAGSGAVVAAVDNPGKLGEVAWSPDGQRLVMISAADLNDPSEGRLTVVSAATGGPPVDLLPDYPGHVADFAWSGSGRLLFLGDEGVATTVNQIAADGSGWTVLHRGGGASGEAGAGSAVLTDLSLAADGHTVALVGEAADHPAELFRGRLDDGGFTGLERLTRSNPRLDEVRFARQEVVRFTARDGLDLEGILIHPRDAEAGRRYPLILAVHGGPESHHSNGWLTGYNQPGQVAAARGFAVFYTNYRGSTGRGVAFSKLSQGDLAGKEFDDLVDAIDHLIARGLVDRDRVGITGGSYGGYATAWGSTRYTDRFAAGVMFVGISELIAKDGTSDIPHELHDVHQRSWPWQDWQRMLERSPVYYVEQARTPLLILGGKDDPRVHPSQSLILYRFLKILDKTPVRLVRYPGEEHGNRKAAARLDYNLRMLRWFEHYLQGPGGAPPPPEIAYRPPSEAGGAPP